MVFKHKLTFVRVIDCIHEKSSTRLQRQVLLGIHSRREHKDMSSRLWTQITLSGVLSAKTRSKI